MPTLRVSATGSIGRADKSFWIRRIRRRAAGWIASLGESAEQTSKPFRRQGMIRPRSFAEEPKMRQPCGICSTSWCVWWLTAKRFKTVSGLVRQMRSANIQKSWRRRSDGIKMLSPDIETSAQRSSTVRDLHQTLSMRSSRPLRRPLQNRLRDDHGALSPYAGRKIRSQIDLTGPVVPLFL
jgi:hypothetical protein